MLMYVHTCTFVVLSFWCVSMYIRTYVWLFTQLVTFLSTMQCACIRIYQILIEFDFKILHLYPCNFRFLTMTESEIGTDSPFSLEAVANSLGKQGTPYVHRI